MPPRLLYVGPAIGSGLGGQALMYKLLLAYPADKLLLVQTHVERISGPPLPGADVINLPSPPSWAGERARTMFDLSFFVGASAWLKWLKPRINAFRPDAIIAVLHGWASAIATTAGPTLQKPLHLIIHDVPDATLPAPRFLSAWRTNRWKQMCAAATSRLCVSPYMAEEVSRLSGLPADVLYPGLAPEKASLSPAAERREVKAPGSLTFAFVGQIHSGYDTLLSKLGRVLRKRGHQLVLHSPQAEQFINLRKPEATADRGWLAVEAVASVLQGEADVAFLPMSFLEKDAENTRVSFPSKLVEYCAAGKPVLVYAPPYSSIARWANDNPCFAVVVDSDEEQKLEQAVARLESVSVREKLGAKAQQLAVNLFSHDVIYRRFLEIICRSVQAPKIS